MLSINNLRVMEVIDINTGEKLGYIKDFKIECNEFKIISIMIPNKESSWFSKNDDIEIPWENIKKIGVDVILIDSKDILLNNN